MNDFNLYQKSAAKTAHYDNEERRILLIMTGLAGETGEIAEKVKKIFREKDGKPSKEDKERLKKELGDSLWYLSELARYFDIELADIAETNITKLADRSRRDVLRGSGDDR